MVSLFFLHFIRSRKVRSVLFSAAKVALFVQNGAVALCAVALCVLLNYGSQWEAEDAHWIVILAQACVVALADVASLASEAQRIILERDWIVIIAGDDQADLASNLEVGFESSRI